MTARSSRPGGSGRRSPGNTRLRAQDLAHLAAAEALRPGVPAADVRSEVIALGRAAMEAGGRIEPARVVLPAPEGPTPLTPEEEAEEREAFQRHLEARRTGWPAGKPKPSERA